MLNESLLKELSEASGVPGHEASLRAIVRRELTGVVDSMEVDAMGNLIATKKGKGQKKLMIAAHMDEIGFIVKFIDPRGFITLQPLGGFDPRQLFAQRMHIHGYAGEVLPGVMTYHTKPAHMLSADEAKQAPSMDKFFVDVGLSAEAVAEKVRIGDMVTLDRNAERCGENFIGKCLDNRVGVFVMLEAMKALGDHEFDIYAVATTQEEIGLRGATTAAYAIDPDVGIALDTTLCCDGPGFPDAEAVTRLGDGVGIKIMDGSMLSHPRLVDFCREIATRDSITHQMEVLPRGGTDGGAIQRARGGNVCITLSVPTRYIHTVNEMVSVTDVQATINLLTTVLQEAHSADFTLA
ncbi:MAG: putative aminopeptidase FrvX [Kiritimatiellia bacterium]|jgi:tetrahedral aminopeptidase